MTLNAPNQKLELVETFRGLAALLVVLHHATGITQELGTGRFLGGAFNAGNIGVNFFFVLSGFIILYTHFDDVGRPARLRQFVVKRFIRIYPTYWLVLVVVLPVYFLVPNFGTGYERDPGVIFRSVLLVPQPQPVLTISWSLSYEIMFYSLVGLAIGLPRGWGRVGLIGLGLAIVAVTGLGLAWGAGEAVVGIAGYTLEFGLGGLAAWWLRRYRLPAPRWIMGAGAGLFGGLEIAQSYGWVELVNSSVVFGLLAMMTIMGAAGSDLYQPVRVPKLLSRLGAASYMIYLTHYIFLSLFIKLSLGSGMAGWLGQFWTTLIITLLAVAGGMVGHYMVERPLIRWCRRKLKLEQKGSQPEAGMPVRVVGVGK